MRFGPQSTFTSARSIPGQALVLVLRTQYQQKPQFEAAVSWLATSRTGAMTRKKVVVASVFNSGLNLLQLLHGALGSARKFSQEKLDGLQSRMWL